MTSLARTLRWSWILPSIVLADVLLVAAAFAWVALYAHLLSPGQSAAAYEAYAAAASPWVSVVLGIPVFFLGARLLARRTAPTGMANVIAALVVFVSIDLSLVAWLGQDLVFLGLMSALGHTTKIVAALLGARSVTRRRDEEPLAV